MAKKQIELSNYVIIGDVHCHPDHHNDRLRLVGNYLNWYKPDYVVQVGDFEDFHSLSSYDVGKKSHEGARYWRDVESVIDGQETLFKPIKKSVKDNIEWFLLGGNHGEGRINKALNNNAQMEELLSIEHCRYEEFGWKYQKYNDILDLNGIFFTHHFNSGNMGKALATENLGKAILERKGGSGFCGHSHLRRLVSRTTPSGLRQLAGDVGCLMDYEVSYMPKECQEQWARGILVLKNVRGADIQDFEWVSLDTLNREYS
jgi:hypothetical protein